MVPDGRLRSSDSSSRLKCVSDNRAYFHEVLVILNGLQIAMRFACLSDKRIPKSPGSRLTSLKCGGFLTIGCLCSITVSAR